MKRRGVVMADTLRSLKYVYAAAGVISAVDLGVFALYRLPMEPFYYAAALGAVLLGLLTLGKGISDSRRAAVRLDELGRITVVRRCTQEPASLMEREYQAMVNRLGETLTEAETVMAARQGETEAYYTAWVHQIKTPIAVMKLRLADMDTAAGRSLATELFRIEQYVEMVLQYVRLGSGINDLVIREYELDDLIRRSIRKFAASFIEHRLTLSFTPTGQKVLTDEKWFACILDQLLSNAVKYTAAGGVTIALTEDGRLAVRDTGIGIAAEDLPLIFEKGYTGNNGRTGRQSSGLGLYLCRRAADRISLPVAADSVPGEGSVFYLDVKNIAPTMRAVVLRNELPDR